MNTSEAFHPPIHTLSLIIPLYNEEDSIFQLRDRIIPVLRQMARQWDIQLILVDDGSTDRTYELLAEHLGGLKWADALILRHGVNRGIGAAMRTGFEAARGDVICTMDSDCTYAPEEMIEMVRLLISSNGDIVTASPYHPALAATECGKRFFLSKMASRLYGLLLPMKLYCYTSFFRVYRRPWARTDLSVSDGFLAVTEIMLAAIYCDANILEYPLELTLRTTGRSKMRLLQVVMDHLGLMGKTMLLNAWLRLRALGRRWGAEAGEDLLGQSYSICEGYDAMLRQWTLVGEIPGRREGVAREKAVVSRHLARPKQAYLTN